MKLKHLFVIISLLALVTSCSEEEEEKVVIPAGVLNETQYAELLAELSMAEAAGNINPKGISGAKYDSAYAFDPLKDKQISKELYDSTLHFYSRHPELFKKVCEDVQSILSEMQVRHNAKIDSVRKADSAAGPVFYVLLKETGKNKDSVLKKIKEIKALSKKESKKFKLKEPDTLKTKITKAEADQIKAVLEKQGARVQVEKSKK